MTCGVDGAHRVAVTILTPGPAVQVPEAILAFLAVVTNNIWFTGTLAGEGVTLGQHVLIRVKCPEWIALTGLTILGIPDTSRRQSITEKSRLTFLTVPSGRVINAPEALSRGPVTVPDGAGVNVAGTLALPTLDPGPVKPLRITKVPVLAKLAPGADPAGGAL